MVTGTRERAFEIAAEVVDPEMPMLTLGDLGVLRSVSVDATGTVEVTLTPTYTGCPALDAMRDDVCSTLAAAGYADVRVRTVLTPAWSTDRITARGRERLAAAGVAPPGPAPRLTSGPVPLQLSPARAIVRCPQCGSPETVELSRFGATACTALRRCTACREPFEHVKEL